MKKAIPAAAVLLTLLLIFTGCAGGDTPETSPSPTQEPSATPEPTEDMRPVVAVEGADYIASLIEGLADRYMEDNESVLIEVAATGSNTAIAELAKGDTDIALSSRTLKDPEKAVFTGMNETVLCMDGIAVIVNPENKVQSLTVQQIKDIFLGEITDWSEVGGEEGEIGVVTLDSSTEVRKAFNSLFLGTDEKGNQQDTDDYLTYPVETGEEMISEVLDDKAAIGYVALSEAAGSTVKTLDIDGVKASAENIKSGDYTFVLNYILITQDLSAEAQAFLDYCTGAGAKAYMITQKLIFK